MSRREYIRAVFPRWTGPQRSESAGGRRCWPTANAISDPKRNPAVRVRAPSGPMDIVQRARRGKRFRASRVTSEQPQHIARRRGITAIFAMSLRDVPSELVSQQVFGRRCFFEIMEGQDDTHAMLAATLRTDSRKAESLHSSMSRISARRDIPPFDAGLRASRASPVPRLPL